MSEENNEWHHPQSTENIEMKETTYGIEFIPLQYRH